MPHEEIPWWNYNLPKEQWTSACPEDLQNSSEKDKGIIGSWNDEYTQMGWDEVKHTIATNRIDLFQRSPSELRRYRRYIYQLEIAHGSIMKFIINHRLKWQSVVAQGPPFSCPEDVKVLYNDWPYGIDKRIIHLVVWVKFELEDDPVTGFLTEEANGQIQNYVDKTFCRRIVPEHVAWFKNWRSLKSIQAVEHFHVMLFDPDMDFVRSITNGDVPQSTITYK